MKCDKCGFDLPAGTSFCSNCGNQINNNNNVVSQEVQQNDINNNVVSQEVQQNDINNNVNNVLETEVSQVNETVQQVQTPVTQDVLVAEVPQGQQVLTTNQIPGNNDKKKIIIVIGIIIAFAILIGVSIFLIVKLTSANKRINQLENGFYENAPYYIVDEVIVDDNSANQTTTTTATTTTRTTVVTSEITRVTESNIVTPTSPVKPTTTVPVVTTTVPHESTTSSSEETSVPTTTTQESITTSTLPPVTSEAETTTGVNDTTLSTTTTTSYTTTLEPSSSSTQTSTTSTTTTPIQPSQENVNLKRTVLVYMVGSDLESKYGSATGDIQEMLDANIDEKTDVLIYAGGTTRWANNVLTTEKNNVVYINNEGLALINYPYDSKNMGESKTLAEFLTFAYQVTDSDKYDLIFWDHGAGPVYGFGVDEVYRDRLYMPEIVSALNVSPFNKNNKLEFIGFDACLMAHLEVGYLLQDYAEYFIASEETEFGYGWNYEFLSNISKYNSVDLGKSIIDSFVVHNEMYLQNVSSHTYTLSMVDLSKINPIAQLVESNFSELKKSLSKDYETIAKNRLQTIEFGKTPNGAYDLIDLKRFITLQDEKLFKDLSSKIDDSIVYNKTNLRDAHGMSVYFPSSVTSDEFDMDMKNYDYLYKKSFPNYVDFISSFGKIRYSKDAPRTEINVSENKSVKYIENKNDLSIDLTSSQMNAYAGATYIIFEKCEDGNYMAVYKGNNFEVKGNTLVAKYNGNIITVREDGDEDFGTLNMYQVKTTNKGTQYATTAVLFNFDDGMNVDSGWANFYVKEDEVTFKDITPFTENFDDEDSKGEDNKKSFQLNDWDSVQFGNFRYNILDEKGKYTRDWKSIDTKYLYEISPRKKNAYFESKKLDPKKEYYGVVNVFDTQGNISSTDLVRIK